MEAPGDLPGLLDRCLTYLEFQGMGPLELAAMSLEDSTAIAKQLAFEMNIPYGGYLDEAVETWLRGAFGERELLHRVEVSTARFLDWHLLQPSSSSASLPKPDPGARPTHTRGTAMESTDRETRLQDIWCARLREELEICGAPVLATLESSLDPGRAIAMLAGRTRATTLKFSNNGDYGCWNQVAPLTFRRDEPGGRSMLDGEGCRVPY